MKRYIFGNVTLGLVKGDITRQDDVQAIVNAANAQLRPGGGVAGAIHRAAGPELEKEAVALGPIKPGQAVLTKGHQLPNQYVIHCLGPVYDIDVPHDQLLASCYINALKLCEKHQISSVAFPAISTGAFGYPVKEAAMVALNTVTNLLPELEYVKQIRFVLYDQQDLDVHSQTLDKLI